MGTQIQKATAIFSPEKIDEQALLQNLKETLLESHTLTSEWREEAKTHLEYYRGRQLPDDVKSILRSRGQPEEFWNVYQMIGNKIVGYKINTRTSIKIRARKSEDKKKAQVVTDILRSFIENTPSDSNDYYSEKRAADFDLMFGICFMDMSVKWLNDKDEKGNSFKEIMFSRGDPLEYYYDPFAKSPNMLDARYLHRVFYVDQDELIARYGDKAKNLIGGTNWINDNDITYAYGTHARKRVQVRLSWYKTLKNNEWQVRYAVWCDNTLLEDAPSPYNMPYFPVMCQKLHNGKQGEFYGLFRSIKPIQDQINYSINRLANMIGSNKLMVEEDAVDDRDEFIESYSRDDSVTFVRPRSIQQGKIHHIVQDNRIAQIMNRIEKLIDMAKVVSGFNEEALGMAVNRLSSLAIDKRSQIGLMGLLHFIDSSTAFDRACFSVAVEQMKQYFTAKQAFLVEDKMDAENFIEINNGSPDGAIDIGRFDISVEFVSSLEGSRAERQANNLEILNLLQRTRPDIVPQVLVELMRDMDGTLGDKIEEILKQADANMAQNPQSAYQQQVLQMQIQKLASEIAEIQSKVQVNQGKAANFAIKAANEAPQGY